MKRLNSITLFGYSSLRALVIIFLALAFAASCASSSSSDSEEEEEESQNDIEGKVFILGAQLDDFGNLVVYAVGTDLDGDVLSVDDMQSAEIIVDDKSYNTDDDPELTITAVADGDEILSLGLLTDYSDSTSGEVQVVADALTQLLDNMRLVFEAQVMTFSNELETQLAWSEDLTAIKAAVLVEHSDPDKTALFDSMGIALEGDTVTDGLIGRCRPAHMLVVFTDGDDNESSVYSDTGIGTIVNQDGAIVIMLSTINNARTDVLTTLAGDSGVVIQVADPDNLVAEVDKWASSLNDMVKVTLDSSVNTRGKKLEIALGSESVRIKLNTNCR